MFLSPSVWALPHTFLKGNNTTHGNLLAPCSFLWAATSWSFSAVDSQG